MKTHFVKTPLVKIQFVKTQLVKIQFVKTQQVDFRKNIDRDRWTDEVVKKLKHSTFIRKLPDVVYSLECNQIPNSFSYMFVNNHINDRVY